MANVLIIYAHPNPKSFNHAIVDAAVAALTAKGDQVRTRDLYALNFNPLLTGDDFMAFKSGTPPADIKIEQDHITWADTLMFVYPMWWGDRPAILKGYIDRVFSNGFAFAYGADGIKGLLAPRRALVFQTLGGPAEWYPTESLNALNKPMADWTLGVTGITDHQVKTFFAVPSVTDDVRHQMLEDVKSIVGAF